jgi:hypothetical protein
MFDQWLTIAGAAGAVLAVVCAGVVARRFGVLAEAADESLLKLVINVLMPCLIFSVVHDNPTLKTPGNLIWPPIVGFGSIVLGFAAAMAVARLGKAATGLGNVEQRRTFVFSVGIHNYGYLAIPLVSLLFGGPGSDNPTLGVLFIHNVGVEMAFWTLGVMVISGRLGRDWWRHAVNPPSIAIVAALAVNYLNLAAYIPSGLATAIDWLGQAAIPLALVLIGATIADQVREGGNGRNTVDGVKVILWSCGLRLGLIPLAMLAMTMLLPASDELKRVVAVEAAMPSAVFSILMARHYAGDAGTALRVVLATSLVSLITIPLWIPAGLALLKATGG